MAAASLLDCLETQSIVSNTSSGLSGGSGLGGYAADAAADLTVDVMERPRLLNVNVPNLPAEQIVETRQTRLSDRFPYSIHTPKLQKTEPGVFVTSFERGGSFNSFDRIDCIPGWLHPGTDYLGSFPPFNVQPTQYRVSVDGKPGWYAQCGFEATAIRWLFPGQTVRVEAPCLDCGDVMAIEMRDEAILLVEPDTIVGYTSADVGGDAANRPFR